MIDQCIMRSLQVMTSLSVERDRVKTEEVMGLAQMTVVLWEGVAGYDIIIF